MVSLLLADLFGVRPLSCAGKAVKLYNRYAALLAKLGQTAFLCRQGSKTYNKYQAFFSGVQSDRFPVPARQ